METEIRPESRRYASDKPVSCKYCYFWGGRKKGCELKECYYLLPEEEPEETAAESACSRCPYGKVTPCIGYCLVKIMRE